MHIPIYKPDREKKGNSKLRLLDELLSDSSYVAMWGQDDFTDYMMTVLTKQLGWNLRNQVMHGEAGDETFSENLANKLIHILLLLNLPEIKSKAQHLDNTLFLVYCGKRKHSPKPNLSTTIPQEE